MSKQNDKCKENLALWEAVAKTNPDDTKPVNFGRKFTAIDAYSQIMHATEQFGSYGKGWGLRRLEHTFVPNTTMVLVIGEFFYPDGQFPVSSSIFVISEKGRPDEDFAKKVETDMITKALSRLGFNADVFMGKFDDQKYVDQVKKEFAQMNPEPVDQEKVKKATEYFKKKIDEDQIEETHEKIKAAYDRLTNDERIAVNDGLKEKAPDSKKMYSTLLKEYLNYHESDGELAA